MLERAAQGNFELGMFGMSRVESREPAPLFISNCLTF